MRRLGILAVIAAWAVGACSGGEQASMGGRGGSGPPVEQEAAAGGGDVSAATLELPPAGATVIKTAEVEVRLEHDAFSDAMARATEVASRHGGFVVSSTRGEPGRGSVIIRVPADRFEVALGDVRALGEVDREHVAGQDVGQEFVDLEARLRNLEAQEAVLLRLFDEAGSVADTIRIQHELSGVQLDVEQIEGRLRYLRDQTALSTITIGLTEEGAAEASPLGTAWRQAGEAIVATVAVIVVGLGYLLPLVLIGGLAFLAVRRAGRALDERRLRPSA